MTSPAKIPRSPGYRMPAEWEPHAATWLSWPRKEGISFPDRFEGIPEVWTKMCEVLSARENVHIVVRDETHEEQARKALAKSKKLVRKRVMLHRWGVNECWCRDHGPIFIVNPKVKQNPIAVVDWGYNAWGGKYPPYDLDDAVPQHAAKFLGMPLYSPPMILEGGSIDVNGRGTLLTTETCLLNPNRNPKLTKANVERYLKDYLGVTKILWLSGLGVAGDDTDGHIDNVARFVNAKTVVTIVEEDPADENYAPLLENLARLRKMKDAEGKPLRVVGLPMPGVVAYKGQRLPASYANFYIANGVVLLPTYRHKKNDARATETLQKLFPNRRVVGIDATDLIWGLGAFHCATQQQPA